MMKWTERSFSFDLPIGWFPAVLERLRGTPSRAEELVRGVSEAVLRRRVDGGWSIKEHIGHLHDVTELDTLRLDEFLARAPELTPADMSNAKTDRAGHGGRPTPELLAAFRRDREALVRRLDALTEEELSIEARHPLLDRPMRLIDWAWFVAEHDDHHLASARRLLAAPAREADPDAGRPAPDAWTAEEARRFCDHWLPLWSGNRPEDLAELYAEDTFYRDPANPAGITGRPALLAYLRRLLARNPDWRWTADAVFPVAGGFVLRWRATIPVGGEVVTETGMDLVLVEDGRITRNEVYFDRSAWQRAASRAAAGS